MVKDAGYYEPVHRQGGGLIDIPQAVLSVTSASPSKISLGEGEAGPITTTVSVSNDSDTAVTYDLGVRHGIATGGATYAPRFLLAEADVSFSADTITVPAGGSATVDVTIAEDFGADGIIYGGWLTLTSATDELTIPFAGMSGDYQALTAFDALLTYLSPEGLDVAEPFHEYSMVDGDYPIIYFTLDYPTNAIYFDIYRANADGTKGAKVHSNFINYATFIDEGRLAGVATIPWDGTYQGNNGNDKYRRVSDGDYVLEVRVLKALGDPSNPDHWEIWNSPAFTIAYGEGADTSAGNGPGAKKGRN
ncbi:Fn3-like domain-containing protein [Tessaracoccus sp. OS52]|nr:Fn3-like domain-containing protein [Tessaracoccus sp. OS52]